MWISFLNLFQHPCSCVQQLIDWMGATIHFISCNLAASPDTTCQSTCLANLLGWMEEQDRTVLSWSSSELSSLHLLYLVVGLLLLHLLLAALLLRLPHLFNTETLTNNKKNTEATKTSNEESSSDSESFSSENEKKKTEAINTSKEESSSSSSSSDSDIGNKRKANKKKPTRKMKKPRMKKKAASRTTKKSGGSAKTHRGVADAEQVTSEEGGASPDSLREAARCLVLPEYPPGQGDWWREGLLAPHGPPAGGHHHGGGQEGASVGTKAQRIATVP